MDFLNLLHYLQNLKIFLSWLVIFGKIDTTSSWQEMSLKVLRTLWIYWVWYFKGFCETTWNWIVFWFHVNCELFMFLPLGCDMWLPGNYLTRYYSLCDIGILAPAFVMVIEFCLCDGDEFHLCDGRLVSSL